MSQLTGSLFIITGAASGIGRAVAVQAAAAGALVLATDRNAVELARTRELVTAAGGQIETTLLDVADPAQVAAALVLLRDAMLVGGYLDGDGVADTFRATARQVAGLTPGG